MGEEVRSVVARYTGFAPGICLPYHVFRGAIDCAWSLWLGAVTLGDKKEPVLELDPRNLRLDKQGPVLVLDPGNAQPDKEEPVPQLDPGNAAADKEEPELRLDPSYLEQESKDGPKNEMEKTVEK